MRDEDATLEQATPNRHGPLALWVSGRTLYCSRVLWRMLEGPKPKLPMGWESDGCSGGSPDVWRTLLGKAYKLWPACVIHDYHYRYGPGWHGESLSADAAGRRKADAIFYRNLVRLIKAQGGGGFRARRVAWLYWGRVRVWGAGSWRHWAPGEQPLSRMERLREAWWS